MGACDPLIGRNERKSFLSFIVKSLQGLGSNLCHRHSQTTGMNVARNLASLTPSLAHGLEPRPVYFAPLVSGSSPKMRRGRTDEYTNGYMNSVMTPAGTERKTGRRRGGEGGGGTLVLVLYNSFCMKSTNNYLVPEAPSPCLLWAITNPTFSVLLCYLSDRRPLSDHGQPYHHSCVQFPLNSKTNGT
jgi:hypothetical protein